MELINTKILLLWFFCRKFSNEVGCIVYFALKHVLSMFGSELKCVQGLPLWRNSSFEINDELFKGYRQGNTERMINEFTAGLFSWSYNQNNSLTLAFHFFVFYAWRTNPVIFLLVAAYDFLNSNLTNFNVIVWYNSTYKNATVGSPPALLRVSRSLNIVGINSLLNF